MNNSLQIKLGALMSYVSLGINILTGLIFTPWMISSIGKENYGLYTLAMSVISLFVFDFGLSSAVTRFLSKYLAEGRQDKADQCLGIVYRLYIYIDIFFLIILSVLYFLIPEIYRELSPEEIEKFKVIYIIAAIFTVISFPFIPVNGILTANEKFIQLKGCEVFHKLTIVILMALCLLMGYGLYAFVLVNAIAGLLAILLKLYFIKRDTKSHVIYNFHNNEQFHDIINFSLWATVIAVCQRMIFTIAPTILGFFTGSAAIAIFGIANIIEGYVFSFSSALSGMFLPTISRIVTKESGDVMPLMIKVGRIQLYIVGAIVMGFVCVGKEFIHLWIGNDFGSAYICSILLIIPSLFQLPQEIGMQTIIAKNKVKEQSFVWIIVAFINIVLSLILTKFYGVIGLCCSICISFLLRTMGMDYLFKAKLKLNISFFFRETFVKIGLSIILITVITFVVGLLFSNNNLFSFIFKSILFVVLFSISFVLVSSKEEKQLVVNILKNILHAK